MWDEGALTLRQECVNPASTYGVSMVMVWSIYGSSMVYGRSMTRPKITIQIRYYILKGLYSSPYLSKNLFGGGIDLIPIGKRNGTIKP